MDILNGIAYESAGPILLQETKDPDVFDATIIREGWGSSGYYDGDVLHRDGPSVFTEGLRVFLDHAEGPVEKAGNVIGVLAGTARPDIDESGRKVLKAPIRIFKTGTHNAEWVKERAKAKAIELSIRSGVKYGQGEREGRYGKVVTALTDGYSVDVVARGGAGGSFGTIQEAAEIHPAASESEEGSDMPLTKEEQTAIAQETALALASALAPSFEGITTALGDLKTAQEAKPVPKTALTARGINEKITAAKLSEKASNRVYLAIESAEVADEETVDKLIEDEVERQEEAEEAAKAALGVEGSFIEIAEESGKPGEQSQGYKTGGVSAWGGLHNKKGA